MKWFFLSSDDDDGVIDESDTDKDYRSDEDSVSENDAEHDSDDVEGESKSKRQVKHKSAIE